jgi:hypothetical protein
MENQKIDVIKKHGGARKGGGRKKGVGITFDIQKHCYDFMENLLKDDAIKLKATKQLALSFDDEKSNNDVLYIIKTDDKYKIGFSTNWEKREKSYKTHSPNHKVIYLLKTHKAFDLEGKLHLMFNTKNIQGEWFELDNEDLLKAVLYCSKEVYV